MARSEVAGMKDGDGGRHAAERDRGDVGVGGGSYVNPQLGFAVDLAGVLAGDLVAETRAP